MRQEPLISASWSSSCHTLILLIVRIIIVKARGPQRKAPEWPPLCSCELIASADLPPTPHCATRSSQRRISIPGWRGSASGVTLGHRALSDGGPFYPKEQTFSDHSEMSVWCCRQYRDSCLPEDRREAPNSRWMSKARSRLWGTLERAAGRAGPPTPDGAI